MTLPLIPDRSTDEQTWRKRVAERVNNVLKFEHDDSRVRTPAEVAAGVTPVNFAYRPGDVRRYGATVDGVTNDRAAIATAFSVNRFVIFPAGTYYIGTFSSASDKAFDLSSYGDDINVVTEGDVLIQCETTANVIASVFYLKDNSNFRCGPIRFLDTGYDPLTNWKGACAFRLDCDVGMSWGHLQFDAIHARNMVQVICCGPNVGPNWDDRIRGIHVGLLYSDDCFYGLNCQNQGDGITVDRLVAVQNYRPYFVYGCAEHDVNVLAIDNRSTSGVINISRDVGGLSTYSIRVNYTSRLTTLALTHVNINHIDLLGGTIANIHVNVDIEGSVGYDAVVFINYSGSGGFPTNDASSNVVRDIFLSGTCDANATAVATTASYAETGRLHFTVGKGLTYATSTLTKFALSEDSTPTVTWTASVSNPAIGNGTLTSDVSIINGLVHINISLTMGSTTTYGTGSWIFSLPYTSVYAAVGTAWMFDTGTAYYVGAAKLEAGAAQISVYSHNTGAGIGSAVPFTWTTGDRLILSLVYRQATA